MSHQKGISRRHFLIGAAGLGVAACGGVGFLAAQQPVITFNEFSCGEAANNQKKVLVTYASQFGSTGEVAAAMAQTLCESGLAATVKLVTNVNDLSPYRAVIVGAPVHADEWMSDALNFVQTNRTLLSKRPVAYFLTCMTLGSTEQPGPRQKIAGVLEKVQADIPEVIPVDKGLFAGALDYSRMSYFLRGMYQGFAEDDTAGDFRDWEAIRAWTKLVGPKLLETG
jgi:menaquinone-dependent protoporphyrinogen oxidase